VHILAVTDQHPESLGGVQVSLRLQRKFLERAGHQLTIVAPRMHRPAATDPNDIALPSIAITRDREYSMHWPGKRTERIVQRALRSRPPVDVVHIQGDFWGALTGYRIARQLGVPVVHTMHNNVDRGTRAVTPLAPLLFWMLNVWRRLVLGPTRSKQRGAWRYLASLAERADQVTAPSAHFAEELRRHGVAEQVSVIPTGVDDDMIAETLDRVGSGGRAAEQPTLVWLGRMSHEKRIMEMLKAFDHAQVDARLELYGGGLLSDRVDAFIAEHDLGERVIRCGAVSYHDALAAIARADAVVQTSIGFETQGMTVFEASALGTPSIVSDPNIADELGDAARWRVADSSIVALADAFREAVATVQTSRERLPRDRSSGFLQSVCTARMISVYDAAVQG